MDSKSPSSKLGSLAAVMAVGALVAACSVAGSGGGSPEVSTGPNPTPAGGFYLRAWQTQALAPQYTFGWMPVVTIANGTYIDGNVVVPAIYPGPLWSPPFARSISQQGIDTIVAEAQKQGLLGSRSNFEESMMPGGISAHIDLSVNGKTYSLTGQPDLLTRCRCVPEPGQPAAFSAFWQKLTGLDAWIPADLGPSAAFEPSRVAVLTVPPVTPAEGFTPQVVDWPLAVKFVDFGTAMGWQESRCGVVSGTDLEKLLPLLRNGNQLTRFKDSSGLERSLQARALVPNEPSPCG